MSHPDDSQLNEYLDGVLDDLTRRQVEGHLAACAECQMRAQELERVFTLLAVLPEVSLTADLSARVMEELRPRRAAWRLALTLSAQAAAAAVMFAWAWPVAPPQLAEAWRIFNTWSSAWNVERCCVASLAWLTAQITAAVEWTQASGLAVSLPAGLWALALGSALVAWLIGNRLWLKEANGTAQVASGGYHG